MDGYLYLFVLFQYMVLMCLCVFVLFMIFNLFNDLSADKRQDWLRVVGFIELEREIVENGRLW